MYSYLRPPFSDTRPLVHHNFIALKDRPDPHRFFRFRYFIVVLILCAGIHNVIRGLLAAGDLLSDEDTRRSYRNARHPIRPWTEREWLYHKNLNPFRERGIELRKARADQALRKADPHCVDKSLKISRPRYWTERAMFALGDRSTQMEEIPQEDWNYGEDGRAANTRYKKTKEQVRSEPAS